LKIWQTCTYKQNQFTIQTQTGLLVSLKGALELSEYLCNKVGYSYLMTRRINQDNIEVSPYYEVIYYFIFKKLLKLLLIYINCSYLLLKHLFGNLRQGCGDNQHPDPLQFKQIYRLLSCYSLIKPPKGSNISGGEMLNSLIQMSSIGSKNDQLTRT